MRVLTESEVTFELVWEPETGIAPDFDDPRDNEWVRERLAKGHTEAWCTIIVTAAWTLPATGEVYTARASLGACSIDSGRYASGPKIARQVELFARDSDLYDDALTNLNERLRAIITEAAALSAYLDPPRRSPEPCEESCPGWAVFGVDRDPGLEIQACDACWHGQPNAPDDDEYRLHPVCIAALRADPRYGRVEPEWIMSLEEPEEPEECEDNACTGCPWCDRAECVTRGTHLVDCDGGDGTCNTCGQR